MNREIITEKQGISIVVMFLIGSAVIMSPGGEAKQNLWIAVFLGFLMAVPMVLVYSRLLSAYPGKDLFEILPMVFGKLFGAGLAILFIWYSFHLGALVIRNFTDFIQIVSLQATPQPVVAAFLGIICIWIVRSGYEVMGRWSGFVFYFLLALILVVTLLSLTQADINHLLPILPDGLKPVLVSAFSIFSFPFAETVVLLMVFRSVKGKFRTTKVYMLGMLLGVAVLGGIAARNVLVLGVSTASILYFPSLSTVSLIDIGDFLQRIEITVSVVFLLEGIVKISVCLYAASNGVYRLFNLDSRKTIVAPVGLLMMGLSCIIYGNTMETLNWVKKIYPYYAIPFQILLPVIIWIVAEIRLRLEKRKERDGKPA